MTFNLNDDPLKFQGKMKKSKYFEGWYFKHVSADLKNIISVIPGISIGDVDSHAFIQTAVKCEINGKSWLMTHYHRFSADDFSCMDRPFCLKIGSNTFEPGGMELELKTHDCSVRGSIRYSEFDPIVRTRISPSAMGFFAYLPFLECYHDIVSMGHKLSGILYLNNSLIDFDQGRGYIEKDWGSSFPKDYIWIQCNSFKDSDASIMCSVADVPFLNASFRGFICSLSVCGQEYRFASYNLSRISKLECSRNAMELNVVRNNIMLEVKVGTFQGEVLKAPQNGIMNTEIREELCGTVQVRLKNLSGNILFQGTGNPCATELFGNLSRLKV